MKSESASRNLPRSIGAIVGGFLTGAVLSIGLDAVLHATGVFPDWGQPVSDGLFALATAYRTVFNVLGCYIAARLAPSRPMAHAMTIGVIGLLLSIGSTAATWHRGPEFGPHWYPVLLIVLCLPSAWLGGMLRERQLANGAATSAASAS